MLKDRASALILVVDDDHHDLFVLQRRLESKDFNVVTASSGKVAMDAAMEHQPDLILLDANMPEMDGYEVKRGLNANEETRNIPVIFLSSRVQLEYKLQAFALGADDYITKPFHADEMTARIENVLRHIRVEKELRAEISRLQTALQGGGMELTNREEAVEQLSKSLQIADSRRDAISVILLRVVGLADLPNPSMQRVVLMETSSVLQEMSSSQDVILAYREEGEFLLFAVGMPTKRAQILAEGLKSSIIVRAFSSDPTLEKALSCSIGISGKDAGTSASQDEILTGAENALQQAAAAGGSRIVVYKAGGQA